MALIKGTLLGPYEIDVALGAGGMGEVYKARDMRLDRSVAIKVLATHLAGNSELKQRLEREARAVSSLNHPHICTLYDIGQQDGVDFLVMEYLEGESLAQRLGKGALPIEQALTFAIQIADALDKAHRQGVVHRDLKPGNIMLTKSGAKLLDFGLAKSTGVTAAAAAAATISPAQPSPLTAQGSLVGTFQYMAPEQFEGKEADVRSDIFAFGVVLYEMLSGRKAFEGKTQASLIVKIMEHDPPSLSTLQPVTPPALERLVSTCLTKDPDERWQTARDLLRELRWIAEGGASSGTDVGRSAPAPAVARRRSRDRWMWAAIAAAACLATAAGVWFLKPEPQHPGIVTRFTYALPDDQNFTRTGRHVVAMAPDGTHFVYVANQQLYLRRMDQLEAQPIRGTAEDPLDPVISPDGQWVVYFTPVQAATPSSRSTPASGARAGAPSAGATSGFTLKKISVSGGAPIVLASVPGWPYGASWHTGTIVFGQGRGGIVSVPEGGGTPQTVVSADPGQQESFASPQFLSNGRELLFTAVRKGTATWNEAQLVIQSLKTGARRVLIHGGSDGRVLPSGHLVYMRDATLFAVGLDRRRLERAGEPVPLIVGIADAPTLLAAGPGQFAVSREGRLAYLTARGQAAAPSQKLLAWVDRQGREQPIAAKARNYVYARLSPDGGRIGVDIREERGDIWVFDLARDILSRLTSELPDNRYSIWMPDGRFLIYSSAVDKGQALFRRSADRTGTPERLTEAGEDYQPQAVSPDGKFLVYRRGVFGGNYDLLLLPLAGERRPQPLLATPFQELNAEISPDGRWLAYESNESGQFEIYVRPFPAVESGRWQVSTNGGQQAAWSRDGRELFYIALDKRLMTVPLQPGSSFSFGRAAPLFDVKPYVFSIGRGYDVSAGGRFVLIKNEAAPAASAGAKQSIVVVEHWFDELKARVGPK